MHAAAAGVFFKNWVLKRKRATHLLLALHFVTNVSISIHLGFLTSISYVIKLRLKDRHKYGIIKMLY